MQSNRATQKNGVKEHFYSLVLLCLVRGTSSSASVICHKNSTVKLLF